jgi:hypothetical protein
MDHGWLVFDSWEDFAAENSLIETGQLTREDVEKARIRAYKEYYFSPRFVTRSLLRVRNFQDVKRLARGGKSVLDRVSFFGKRSG